jgi:hypothetical protein
MQAVVHVLRCKVVDAFKRWMLTSEIETSNLNPIPTITYQDP